jgi:phage shock protein PspC (stress-responsive transcriptional regulator)
MIERCGLFRDPARGWLAGVAAGLAGRFAVSAGVVRLIFVLLALAGAPVTAILLYAILAVLLPVAPTRIETGRIEAGPFYRRYRY